MPQAPESREIIFEFARFGSLVRVTAIDCETGIEAVTQGPASAGQLALQLAAKRKLAYVLRKKAGETK